MLKNLSRKSGTKPKDFIIREFKFELTKNLDMPHCPTHCSGFGGFQCHGEGIPAVGLVDHPRDCRATVALANQDFSRVTGPLRGLLPWVVPTCPAARPSAVLRSQRPGSRPDRRTGQSRSGIRRPATACRR